MGETFESVQGHFQKRVEDAENELYSKELKQRELALNQTVKEVSETSVITDFEKRLLLSRVDLEEYENRIKMFCFHSYELVRDDKGRKNKKLVPGQSITLKQMKESFKNHPILSQILDDSRSLDRKLLLNEIMYVENANNHILKEYEHDQVS